MHTWTPASDLSSVSGHFGTALYVSNVAVENPGSHKGVAIIQSKRGVIFFERNVAFEFFKVYFSMLSTTNLIPFMPLCIGMV